MPFPYVLPFNLGPKTAELTDDFTTADTAKWNFNGTASVVSGQANLVPGSSYGNSIVSTTRYDLTGSAIYARLVQTPNLGNGSNEAFLGVQIDPSNSEGIGYSGGNLLMRETVANVTSDATLTYNSVDHRYLRIRESGGTIYWDTSPDGSTWTNRRSKAAGINVTSVQALLVSGYYGTEPSPGTAIFDDFNCCPLVETLTDDFTSNTGQWGLGSGVTISGGTLNIPVTAAYDGFGNSSVRFDATGSSVFAKIIPGGTGGTNPVIWGPRLRVSPNNEIGAIFSGGAIYLNRVIGGVYTYSATYPTYDPVNHAWVRVRESGGTVYLDVSPSGAVGSWTQIESLSASTLDLTNVQLSFYAGLDSGTSAVPMVVDNVNVAPPSPTGAIAAALQKMLFTGSSAHGQAGSISSALQKALFNGSASQAQSGTVAALVQAASFNATGIHEAGRIGDIASLLRYATMAASGEEIYTGSLVAQLQRMSFAGSSIQTQTGSIAATARPALFVGTASQVQTGAIVSVMRPTTAVASGFMRPEGPLVSALPPATFAGSGLQSQTGAIAAQLQRLAMQSAGSHAQSGSIAAAAQKLLMAAVGQQPYAGTIVSALQRATAALSGQHAQAGALASQLQRMLMASTGLMQPEGVIAATARAALMSASGSQLQTGTISAAVQKLVFSVLAEQILSGSLSSAMQDAEAELLGSMFPEGSISSELRYALFSSGVGSQGLIAQIAGQISGLLFAGEGYAVFIEATPAERVLEFLAASRLLEVLATTRDLEAAAPTRSTEALTATRSTDIRSLPREVAGG